MSLTKDERFFYDNAGWATPPGRAECARQLARAEQEARKADLQFVWTPDEDSDLSFMTDDELEQEYEVLVCEVYSRQDVLTTLTKGVLASLGGIVNPDSNYRRVVEAELVESALEELAAIERIEREIERIKREGW